MIGIGIMSCDSDHPTPPNKIDYTLRRTSSDPILQAAYDYDSLLFRCTFTKDLGDGPLKRVVPVVAKHIAVTIDSITSEIEYPDSTGRGRMLAMHMDVTGDTIYNHRQESDKELNKDFQALYHRSIGVEPLLFAVKSIEVAGIDSVGTPHDLTLKSYAILPHVVYDWGIVHKDPQTKKMIIIDYFQYNRTESLSFADWWIYGSKNPRLFVSRLAPKIDIQMEQSTLTSYSKLRFTLTLVDGRSLIAEVPLR